MSSGSSQAASFEAFGGGPLGVLEVGWVRAMGGAADVGSGAESMA